MAGSDEPAALIVSIVLGPYRHSPNSIGLWKCKSCIPLTQLAGRLIYHRGNP